MRASNNKIATQAATGSKEALFLLMTYATGSKTEAFKLTKKDINASGTNSLNTQAYQYSQTKGVKQIEPIIKDLFMANAIKMLKENGYITLTPNEAIKYMQLINQTNIDQIMEENKRLKQEISEIKGKANMESNTTTGGEESRNKINFNDLPGIDLSNKEDVIRELQRRYISTFDDKTKNDIMKMIIDVQNMKKQEDQEDDTQTKHYYLPLRKCEKCPELHNITATVI